MRSAPAAAATRNATSLYGAVEELTTAAASGIRVERAVFPLLRAPNPFLSARDRDLLWEMFQVPVYALLVDRRGAVVAYECEAEAGYHLLDRYRDGVILGQVESKLCECGRPGPRLMPGADWEEVPLAACGEGLPVGA